ncbi:hypothetical protein G7Z17_g5800 [Cylindrodendrum hubeiense]|uniref:Apple domain-containing protein n=1 Tax=Cylindrodendrum hubeiense TaxID=595255 RepID=A0A9P5H8C6_9HYPO|nr:hypothetical protein G7Z17_g5800 [Cylindrodendrum hubeiense]
MRLLTALVAVLPLVSSLPASSQSAPSFNPLIESLHRRTNIGGRTDLGPSCGLVGYDQGNPDPIVTTDYKCRVADCPALCESNPDCKSYAISDRGCSLYAAVVLGNFLPDAYAPFTFYDKDCPLAGFSTSASTTDIASSTSEASKSTAMTDAASSTSEASTSIATTDAASSTSEALTTVAMTDATTSTSVVPAVATVFTGVIRLELPDGSALDYISPYISHWGNLVTYPGISSPLKVRFTVDADATVSSQLNLIAQNYATYVEYNHLSAIAQPENVNNNFGPGSYAYAFLGSSFARSTPQNGIGNSYGRVNNVATQVESAILPLLLI